MPINYTSSGYPFTQSVYPFTQSGYPTPSGYPSQSNWDRNYPSQSGRPLTAQQTAAKREEEHRLAVEDGINNPISWYHEHKEVSPLDSKAQWQENQYQAWRNSQIRASGSYSGSYGSGSYPYGYPSGSPAFRPEPQTTPQLPVNYPAR